MSDIIRHWRRHWPIIVGTVIVCLAVAFVVTSFLQPTYRAAATLRIDEKRSSLPVLDALRLPLGPGEIETEVAVLRSRSLAEEVVDSLTLQVGVIEPRGVSRSELFTSVRAERDAPAGEYVMSRQPNGSVVVEAIAGRRIGEFTGDAPMNFGGLTLSLSPRGRSEERIRLSAAQFEDALVNVVNRLNVSRLDRDANVVLVRFDAADRILTRDVPNVLVTRFLARREAERTLETRSTVKLLREQRDSILRQLARAEGDLRDFRERAQAIDLTTEAAVQVSHLADLQAQRNTIAAERDALATLLSEVDAAARTTRPGDPSPYRRMLAFPTLLRNPAASEWLRALGVVEDQRASLRTRRTVEDPDVQVLSARVAEIEDQVSDVAKTYVQSLSNQVAALDATLARSGQNLARIPGKEVQYARLQRGPKVLEEILSALQTRLKEAEIAQAVPDSRIRIVDLARLPRHPIQPNLKLNLAIALLVGLALGAGAAVAYGAHHRTIRTLDDVKAVTATPVLGLIPHMRPGAIGGRGVFARLLRRPSDVAYESPGPAAEAYRALRTNITHGGWGTGGKTLLFTSPRVGDGKTTSALNTALALAQQGMRVILVDADLRRGDLHRVFGVRQSPGLAEILTDRYSSVEELLQRVLVNDDRKLDFITSGSFPPNPAELLGSQVMAGLIAFLKREYDFVVFDSPPVNLVTDAAVLSSHVDGLILVTRAGATGPEALEFAMERLQRVESRVIGVVLNDVDFRRDARSYGIEDYAAYYATPSS